MPHARSRLGAGTGGGAAGTRAGRERPGHSGAVRSAVRPQRPGYCHAACWAGLEGARHGGRPRGSDECEASPACRATAPSDSVYTLGSAETCVHQRGHSPRSCRTRSLQPPPLFLFFSSREFLCPVQPFPFLPRTPRTFRSPAPSLFWRPAPPWLLARVSLVLRSGSSSIPVSIFLFPFSALRCPDPEQRA